VSQLAVEAVFLEATQRLEPPTGPGLSVKQADALQHLAFDWILSADKYVDPRFQELAVYRDQVLAGACISALPCIPVMHVCIIQISHFCSAQQ
jgi:hypothetical protein